MFKGWGQRQKFKYSAAYTKFELIFNTGWLLIDLRPQNVKQLPPKTGHSGNSFTRKRAKRKNYSPSVVGGTRREKKPRIALIWWCGARSNAWTVKEGGWGGRKQLFWNVEKKRFYLGRARVGVRHGTVGRNGRTSVI